LHSSLARSSTLGFILGSRGERGLLLSLGGGRGRERGRVERGLGG